MNCFVSCYKLLFTYVQNATDFVEKMYRKWYWFCEENFEQSHGLCTENAMGSYDLNH